MAIPTRGAPTKLAAFAVASLLAFVGPAQGQKLENVHIGQVWRTVAVAQAVLSTQPGFAGHAQLQVAEANPSDGAQLVRSLGDEVIAILSSGNPEQRRRKFHDIFTNAFDVDAMAQFVAGNYWRRADDRQRQEYVKLFGGYVAALYANKFADYAGQSFKVAHERASGDNIAVEGSIVQGEKPPVRCEFRLRRTEAGLKIVDVYVEGMSLIITKRDEFMTVLSREGMDGLLQRLRAMSQG
jgi:phospholipid transport system substrate-binding protein